MLRSLRGIEHDLAVSDPDLFEFYWWFYIRTAGRKMPRAERVPAWPIRLLGWLVRRLWRGKSVKQRVRDWIDENWNDP